MTEVTRHRLPGRRIPMEDPDWPTVPTSMMQDEVVELPSGLRSVDFTQTWRLADADIVVRPSEQGDITTLGLPKWEKRYWYSPGLGVGPPTAMMLPSRAGTYIIFLETAEEHLGHPGDVVASMSPWPPLWQHTEPDPRIWRGVFSPTYNREVLFTQNVEISTVDLPRWKPHVMIDLRRLERKDE